MDPFRDESQVTTAAPTQRPGLSSDLRSRVGAGLALGALTFGLAWAGLIPFGLLVAAVALIIGWEWSHVTRDGAGTDLAFWVQSLAVGAACVLAILKLPVLGFSALMIGTILVGLIEWRGRPLLSAAGVLYSGWPALALLWLRGDQPWGFTAILFLVAAVAATDVAAFFVGRTIGGPKLAASISPNKTWSGFIGGITAAAGVGALCAHLLGGSMVPLALTGLALGVIAQGGDLAESALKRKFNVKDASNLIPGHGGFMDRVDGLAAAAIAAALLASLINPMHPAAALLLGG
jgi:phosphatidate cytidylyltransferase